uniref:Uncharacterized protein n=1 Tax=Romanomermis culicivorax TaxID=13658 RepID=A0A915IEK5_ROMCU
MEIQRKIFQLEAHVRMINEGRLKSYQNPLNAVNRTHINYGKQSYGNIDKKLKYKRNEQIHFNTSDTNF